VKGGSRCWGIGWEKRLFGKRAAAVWGPALLEGREKGSPTATLSANRYRLHISEGLWVMVCSNGLLIA